MSRFRSIFDVFSRRPESSEKPVHDIPESTRNRVLLWCNEVFSNERSDYGTGDYRPEFWEGVHRHLLYRHGRLQLSAHTPRSRAEDAIAFLATCPGEQFLDFLEYIFRVECYFHVAMPEERVVEELNELLRQDDLPYHVTEFIKEEVADDGTSPFPFRGGTVIKTVAYPTVILRESEVLHAEAVAPALKLLQRPQFKNANAEYLEALEDYRKGDFADSLTKCGSAFESVLKILCKTKSWTYQETDTAKSLVNTLLANSNLPSYF